MNVPDLRGELGDLIEVPDLPWGVTVQWSGQGVRQGLVVDEDMKGAPFDKKAQVFDCQIHAKECVVEGAVLSFPWFQFP